MLLRVTFFAMMALGLLGLGFIAYSATRPPAAAQASTAVAPPPVLMRVLTTSKEITAANLLKPGAVGTKEVPVASVPAGATVDNEDERRGLVGAMLRRSLG